MDTMLSTLFPLQEALIKSITPSQIITVLASIVGVGMTFVLMWFGVRKLISIFKNSVLYGSFFDADYREYRQRMKQIERESSERGDR